MFGFPAHEQLVDFRGGDAVQALLGSSASRIFGSNTSALAKPARFLIAPESADGYFPPSHLNRHQPATGEPCRRFRA